MIILLLRIPAFSRLHAPATRPASAWPLATLPKTLFSAHGCRSRIHRMRVAGNTLGASCCRTCRCRCVSEDSGGCWLLPIMRLCSCAPRASLLPRCHRVRVILNNRGVVGLERCVCLFIESSPRVPHSSLPTHSSLLSSFTQLA